MTPYKSRPDELIRRGNKHPYGFGGLVYSPEFDDWRGARGQVARIDREGRANLAALVRLVNRRTSAP